MKIAITALMFASIIFSQAICFSKAPDPKLSQKLSESKGATSLYIENKGQIGDQHGKPNREVKYLILRPGLNIQLKANSFSYDAYTVERFTRVERLEEPFPSKMDKQNDDSLVYHFSRVDIELVDANPSPQITQEGASSDYLNYYTHITSQTHGESGVTEVRGYSNVVYHDIYPNIDLEWFLDKDGKPEYQFIINPGGDPSRIRLKYHGAQKTELISDAIQIHIKPGIIKEHIPLSYLKESKEKLTIAFTKISNNEYGFNIPTYASNETLIIDPMPNRFWGTYYGGSESEIGHSLSIDKNGNNIYLTGETGSNSEIASSGAWDIVYSGLGDAFLSKFSNLGRRVWATYFGGSSTDIGFAVTFVGDSTLKLYVTGKTYSASDISTTGSWDTLYGGIVEDAFLIKFSSSGIRIWGTYFGGSSQDYGQAISSDKDGNIYIAGETRSSNIATTGAWNVSKNGTTWDLFLAKFSPNGNLFWSTYYGGNGGGIQTDPNNHDASLITDHLGNVFLSGHTNCPSGIASSGAWNDKIGIDGYQLDYDIFLAKFSTSGNRIWGTYFGGESFEYSPELSIDKLGNIYLAGSTNSKVDISSYNADDTSFAGFLDVFLTKFSNNGVRLWGTYFGGNQSEKLRGVSVDSLGHVFITGITNSNSEIASSQAWDTTLNGIQDCFLAKYSAEGNKIWSSYYGGEGKEESRSIITDNSYNIYLAGYTTSASAISSLEAWNEILNGIQDIFIVKFDTGYINNISKPILSKNSYCSNEEFEAIFTVAGKFPITNSFFVQLSDQSGSFINPTIIGSINSNSSGKIQCRIPIDTPFGSNYRIRIVSSDTNVISQVNANNITVNLLPNPIISGPQDLCSGIQIHNYGVPFVPGHLYNWQKPDRGIIVGSNSVNTLKVRWITVGSDSLKIRETNSITGCMKDTVIFIAINSNPSIAINGAIKVCNSLKSERYFVDVQPEMSCKWISPLKGSILGNDKNKFVDIVWSIPGIDTLKLIITNLKTGCSTDTFVVVNVLPQPKPIITGNREVVEQEKGILYSVQQENGSTYDWIIVSGDANITTKNGHLVVLNVGGRGAVVLKVIQTNVDGCINESQIVITVKAPTSVQDESHLMFTVYPNPTEASDELLVQIADLHTRVLQIELVDVMGVSMVKTSIEPNNGIIPLNIHGITSGMYIVRVHTAKGIFSEKVIVN